MFVPTYADYVNSLGRNPDMTEAQWNALSDADKMNVTGGSVQIRANDPRYADLAGQTGGEAGRNLYVTSGSRQDFHGGLVGPEANLGNNLYAHNESSQSPALQAYGHQQFDPLIAGIPLLFLGGAGLVGEGPFAGLFGGASGASEIGTQLPLLTDGGGLNAMNTSLVDSLSNGSFWGGAGDAAGSVGSNWASGGGFDAGGLDPETLGGQGGMGVSQNGIGPGSLMDRITGAINNPSSLFSSNGLAASGLSSLMPNSLSGLLNLIGTGTTVAGLLGNHGNSGPSAGTAGSSGGSSKGGNGTALNVSRGQYTPNPYTQAQLQNFQYARPRALGGM